MKKEINIKEFLEKFNDEYTFLYSSNGSVCGEKEATRAFDNFSKQHGDFVREFVIFRGDFISSDREAAAFMFALDSMGS